MTISINQSEFKLPFGTTSIVIDKAQGVIDLPTSVDSAYFDNSRHEFVICISGTSNEAPEKSSIIISDKIIADDGDDRGSISRKTLKDETKSHWWGYEDRKDLQVYQLKTRVLEGCRPESKSGINVPIIRAPDMGDPMSLLRFKGNLIESTLEKNSPFVIFIPSDSVPSSNLYPNKFSSCEIVDKGQSCLLIVLKPNAYIDPRGETGFSELLTVVELTSAKNANALWYLALPFSVAVDTSIDLILIMTIMAILSGGRV
ncbi:MAG: hypothetical protein ACU83P_02910 [Gammaproteobacteria bacterium]